MVAFIVVFLVVVLVILPIWTIVKINSQNSDLRSLEHQVGTLETEVQALRQQLRATLSASTPPTTTSAALPREETPIVATPHAPAPVDGPHTPPLLAVTPTTHATPEPAKAEPPQLPTWTAAPEIPVARAPAEERGPRINWEQFMGAKMFAWLGGVALFLGVAFFVKYSFEHDLIPPEVRVALGFILSAGLIVGGLKLSRERYAILTASLCATGIVSLYAVTFACHSVYDFAFFGPLPTFLLMTLITATAFLLAVRLEARVVAVLGMLGGFLTPVLLSTGQDNPGGLFGYLALLNLGLIAVALHRRWGFLVGLGAGGTILMQLGWAARFFAAPKALTAVIICLAFCALFFAAYLAARRWGRSAPAITAAALALPAVSFGFAFFFLSYPAIGAQPWLLFTFVLLADAVLLAIAWLDEELPQLHLFAGAAAFALLAAWTIGHVTDDLLPWALAFVLLYAALHTAFPLVLQRHRLETAPTGWSQAFPPLALLLLLLPLFKLETVSLLLWPAILLVDLLAIVLALVTASLAVVAIALVLTLGATGLWLFKVPETGGVPESLLLILGGVVLLFFAAGIFLSRRLGEALVRRGESDSFAGLLGDARAQIPAFSALLPFVLLIMMTQRLALTDPSPVFGLALLLVVLTLGLARMLAIEWLPACALAGVAALEYAWHARFFSVDAAPLALGWYLGFYALFTVFPFVFRTQLAERTGPWAVAALAGLAQFPLVYRLVQQTWPNDYLGVLPVLFAVAPLLSLVLVLRTTTADHPARLNQLAWFGGVALFFITLIFPIQFERQWITLGWALEGAALLWLFHRVPHPGLRGTGVVLLLAAFARLALNREVLGYQIRSEVPIFNWYLYSYAVVIVCLALGARLLAPPRERTLGLNAPPLLNALALVLAFLLVNIEIADYFSQPGQRFLAFQFSGNFARDMTYTIAWALFALGLLLLGIWKQTKPARYAAIALLSVALLKLFLHDLSRLGQLYRVGALFAVAAIAILASFAYQRFLPHHEKPAPPKPEA